MVLSDKTILKAKNLIEGMNEENLQSSSYDLTLDEMVSVNTGEPVIAIKFGEPVIAKAREWVNLPDDVVATVILKSSYIRQGLSVEQGHYDAGFKGHPNVQISTNSVQTKFLIPGKTFAQIVFYKVDTGAQNPYDGHYQNQRGIKKSIFNESDESIGCIYGEISD